MLLVKSDVAGSLDAIESALKSLTKEDGAGVVKVQLIGSGVGEINMADIAMAAVRKAWVIAFNVAASNEAAEHARARGIKVSYYNIIYELLDELELKMNKVCVLLLLTLSCLCIGIFCPFFLIPFCFVRC